MPAEPTTQTSTEDGQSVALLGAVLAVSAWGSSGVVIKHISLGSLEIAIYRFAIFATALTAYMAVRRTPLTWRALRIGFWGGLALGLDVAFFFEAVKRTTIINATVIGTLQPLLVSMYAARVENERIDRRNVVLGGVALAGAIGVVAGSSGRPEWNLDGDLLAVGALVTWSAYFILSKRSQGRITSTEYTAATAVVTVGVNIALALAIGVDWSRPAGGDLFWLLVLAFAAGLVGHSLMNWSLVRIPLWVGSVTTLFIPVSAAILAWIFLGESLNAVQIVSMTVVIGALATILRHEAT